MNGPSENCAELRRIARQELRAAHCRLRRENSIWRGVDGTGSASITKSYNARWSSNSSVQREWVIPSRASVTEWA